MKILVVDDSKTMRMIVIRHIRQAGYGDATILEAGNGLEGLDLVAAASPDLILSDWNMPEMTGIEFLQALRQRGYRTPFGFVTSEGSPEMVFQARSEGAKFLIAKPFNQQAFEEKLAEVAS